MSEILKINQELDIINDRLHEIRDATKQHLSRKNIQSVQPEYLVFWEKYSQDKVQYRKDFLKISLKFAPLLDERYHYKKKMEQSKSSHLQEHSKLVQKIKVIEEKYEKTSEILREKRSLKKKIEDIADALKAGRTKLNSALLIMCSSRTKFVKSWKRYKSDSKLEKEFLEFSSRYATAWVESVKEENQYRQWRRDSAYDEKIVGITRRIWNLEKQFENDESRNL